MDIAASVARVWSVLTDVRGWPAIRADIHDVTASGPAAPDVTFSWATDGFHLVSTFGLVEPGQLVTWTTHVPGLAMVHRYAFESNGRGGTRLQAEESLTAPALNGAIQREDLAARIESWLQGIKSVAEDTRQTEVAATAGRLARDPGNAVEGNVDVVGSEPATRPADSYERTRP